jgi:hypothetical protein
VRGLDQEHASLAFTDHVKLRLGFVNSQGQQKGVDSLIVTDLIELARNRAISDALLLSGDEDVRIGVSIAQSFGVRVHLLGIAPCRGSQSLQLMQEADTTSEWSAEVVARFLTHSPSDLPAQAPAAGAPATVGIAGEPLSRIEEIARSMAASLSRDERLAFDSHSQASLGLPREIDGKLLARGRAALGRDLLIDERRHARQHMVGILKAGIA